MNLNLTSKKIDYYTVATRFAAMLGRKFGVQIVFGMHPQTDGTLIGLPHMDMTDTKLRTALYGMIVHEAGGHIRQSDFQAMKNFLEPLAKDPDLLTRKSIFNVLEDIRIENNLLAQYAGFRGYINSTIDYIMLRDPASPEGKTYWPLAVEWSLYAYRARLLHQDSLSGIAKAYEEVFAPIVGLPVLEEAMAIGERILLLDDQKSETYKVFDLTNELFELFERNLPSKQPDTQPEPPCSGDDDGPDGSSAPGDADGSGDKPGSSAPGDADGSGDKPGSSAPGDADGTGDKPGSSAPGDADGSGDKPGSSGSVSGSKAKPSISEDLLTEELGNLVEKLRDLGKLPDQNYHPVSTSEVPAGASTVRCQPAHHLLAKARALSQRLTPSLAPMLIGDQEEDFRVRTGTRIDSRRLSRVVTQAQPALFIKRHVEDDQSVAFQVLLDCSGSTGKTLRDDLSVLDHIMISALGLLSSLESFPNVEVTASCFPPLIENSLIGHTTLKPSDMPLAHSVKKWPLPHGMTPLAEAFMSCGMELLASNKDRKILFVVTDGKPDSPLKVSQAKLFLSSLGIEVFGIVLDTPNYPLDFFDDSEHIASADLLPEAIRKLVYRIL